MFGLLNKKDRVEEKEIINTLRKEKIALLSQQRSDIFETFNNYATICRKLTGVYCYMPNAEKSAISKDENEGKNNVGWYKSLYEEYVNEKNNLLKEKFDNESLLLTYQVEYPERNDISAVYGVVPFPELQTTAIPFNKEMSNYEEVLDSLINVFFYLEEEETFMKTINSFDKVDGFIGNDEEIGLYYKFLRNDLYALAIDLTYDYASEKTALGVPFEPEMVDDILIGIDYTQKSILFVLEELVKTAKQAQEFEAYIDELNNTPADDFETYINENK